MKTTIETGQLLIILRKNRDAHSETFDKAWDVYRQRVIDMLEQRLDEARNGGRVQIAVRLPEPEEHTDDYDRVIRMLELHTEDTIELSETDVAQYVMDDWGWARSFASNTTAYLVGES